MNLDFKHKWRTLLLLSLAELLAMAVWFAASAVIPALTDVWALDDNAQAWLKASMQIGLVVGALGSAVLMLADRIPSRRFFTITAFAAAIASGLIPLIADGLVIAVILRFLTGMFLAGVYPVGIKIMTTWTKEDRGLGIGLLIGALAIGSASPHLLSAIGDVREWESVLYVAAGLALVGGLIGAFFIREGPYVYPSPKFDWKHISTILRDREVMLANLGYLGHMWELYAMRAWIPAFLVASFALSGVDSSVASLVAFAVIAIGAFGSVIVGKLADRLGRTTLSIISLLMSGTCSLLIGLLFGGNPVLLTLVALVWGFAIVADAAQFSASVSELVDEQLIGTALTLQTSMGFMITVITIALIPFVVDAVTWQWAFAFLALGPIVGIIAMLALRRSPQSIKLAAGKR